MISDEDLKIAIMNHGEIRAHEMLKIMADRQPYFSVITSELGQILLKKHIEELKEVYKKIFDGDTDRELILYAKGLEKILDFWCRIMSAQTQLNKTLKGEL